MDEDYIHGDYGFEVEGLGGVYFEADLGEEWGWGEFEL